MIHFVTGWWNKNQICQYKKYSILINNNSLFFKSVQITNVINLLVCSEMRFIMPLKIIHSIFKKHFRLKNISKPGGRRSLTINSPGRIEKYLGDTKGTQDCKLIDRWRVTQVVDPGKINLSICLMNYYRPVMDGLLSIASHLVRNGLMVSVKAKWQVSQPT